MKTKRILSLVLCILMVLSTINFTVLAEDTEAPDTTWYNEEATEFTLDTVAELKGFSQLVNNGNSFQGKTVKLDANIDLNNEPWTPIGYSGKSFKGTFDGQNKTISNLNFSGTQANEADNNNIGLFGKTESPALIQNLTVENATISGSLNVGVIVGNSFTGKGIVNCHVKGNIKVDAWWYAGVIGGNGYTSPIKDCTVAANADSYVKGNDGSYIGGIWGFRGEGSSEIENCSVSNIAVSGVDRVGGISGMAHYGNTISNCAVANTTISASDENCKSIGLIAGANNGTTAQPSIVVNNTVDTTVSADVAGETVTSTTGGTNTNSVTEATVVGTGVTFDDAGKISGGKFEIEPAASKLADDFVVFENDDGSFGTEKGNQITIGETSYETLDEAIAAAEGETVITLSAGTYTIPSSVTNKNITFKGKKETIIKLANEGYEGGVGANGSTLAFEGVTVEFNSNGYRGFKHSTKITYKDCAHIGTEFLYAPEVSYTNCTFNIEGDAYAVWTYGAKDVDFTNCTFNTDGKAILVYTEGAHNADITVSGCTFNATTNRSKAAVEIGQSANGNTSVYNVTITESTANNNFVANNTESNLWGNKNDMPELDVTVVINAEKVYGTDPVAKIGNNTYKTLEAAFEYAKENSGSTITLLNDIELSDWTAQNMDAVAFTLNGNGKTITGLKTALIDSMTTGGHTVVIENLTIKGAKNAGLESSHSGVVNAGGLVNVVGYKNITLRNVNVIDSEIGGDSTYYAGGLIGYVAATENSILNIENCSVKNTKITSTSSAGGLFGHSNGGKTTITGTVVSKNTLKGEKEAKEGSVIGTLTGSKGTKIDVTEEEKSTGTGVLNINGRLFTEATYTGGSYFTDPRSATATNEYTEVGIAETFILKENNDKFTVVPVCAKIGDTEYETFAGAVNAVENNGTVTIIHKVEDMSVSLSSTKTFTVVNNTGDSIIVKVNDISYTIENNAQEEITYTYVPSRPSRPNNSGSTRTYTIKFNTNGGNTIKNVSVESGSKLNEPAVPEKEGFIFEGWYTDKELNTKYDFDKKVTKAFTLYAKWTEKPEVEILLTIGKADALVNGETVTNDVVPIIVNDRTMLPIRFIAEALGAKVEWFEETETVKITLEDIEISLVIGDSFATVNGEKVELDSPSFIENDRTYLPIRFVAENLGAKVEWNEELQLVTITK